MSTTTPAPTTKAERHTYAVKAAVDACESLNPFALARLARCCRPVDTAEGEGVDALRTARSVAVEACEWELDHVDPDEAALICSGNGADTLADLTDDAVWQGIDGTGVLIYTARKQDAFHQLNGWDEDLGDFGTPSSLDEAATWALFGILRRAASAVVDYFAETYAEAVAEFPELDEDGDE